MNLFVVGAGFTKAVFPEAPLNAELLEALAKNKPDSVVHQLKDKYGLDDVEIVLTKLDADIRSLESQTEDLRRMRKNFQNELIDYLKQFSAREELKAIPWIKALVEKVFSKEDVVVALNYDCLLEGLLDMHDKWSPHLGYSQWISTPIVDKKRDPESPVTVLKIHGSVNFVVTPAADKPEQVRVGFQFNSAFFPCSAQRSKLGHIHEGEYLMIPSYVKTPSVEMNYLMLDALDAAAKAKNLVFVGTAMRPEDPFLGMLVARFLRDSSGGKLIVADPRADELANKLKQVFWGLIQEDNLVPLQGRLENIVPDLVAELE